jgi:hypothetical protein
LNHASGDTINNEPGISKSLGAKVPSALIATADEVIE